MTDQILCIESTGEWVDIFTAGRRYNYDGISEQGEAMAYDRSFEYIMMVSDNYDNVVEELGVFKDGRVIYAPNNTDKGLYDSEIVKFVLESDLTQLELFHFRMTGRLPDER